MFLNPISPLIATLAFAWVAPANAGNIALTDSSLEAAFSGTNGTPVSGWFSTGSSGAANPVGPGTFWGETAGMTNRDGSNAAYAYQVSENDGGAIYQTVSLNAGATYTLTAAVGMSAAVAKDDGRFALVFFNSDFSTLEAETTGTITTRGSFADYSANFTPPVTGSYQIGLQNRGYVPNTGGIGESTVFFDHVRLTASGGIGFPAGIDVSSHDTSSVQSYDVVFSNNSGIGLEISDIRVAGPDSNLFTVLTAANPDSPFVIGAGTNGTVALSFQPNGWAGNVDAMLEVTPNPPGTPPYLIPISGLVREPWIPPAASPTVPYFPATPLPGAATGSISENTAILSNQAISVSWRELAGVWKFESATNHYTGISLAPTVPTELFTVELSGGIIIPASSMTLSSGPTLADLVANPSAARYAEQAPGKQITLVFQSAPHNLQATWTAELRDGSHYVRPSLTLTTLNSATVTTSRITLLDLTASDFTQVGAVDGSPLVSDDFFIAFEHPSAQNGTNAGGSGQQIGTWAINESAGTSYGPADSDYDITSIAANGNLAVTFNYTSGPHRLNINSVRLLKNGVEESSDIHFGYAGLPDNANTYTVTLADHDPAATYTIRTNTDVTETGSDSNGNISLAISTGMEVETSVTGNVTLSPADSSTYTSVYGVIAPGQQRRSYLFYTERERAHAYRQFLHYNSWLDVSWNENGGSVMTETNTLTSMQGHIDNLIEPYNEPYNAFVFDDGWDNWNSLWDFNTTTFPSEFTPMESLAGSYGVRLGAWLSPFGGYDPAKSQRIAFGQSQIPAYETNANGFSLSGPNYFAAFKNRCLQMIGDYSFSYFKFDGIGAGNGASGAGSQYFGDIEAMRDLTSELRQAQNDLFINLTVGSWPSPYWLWSADSIWRAGSDMGFTGAGNNHERWITYRDNECYKNVVQRAPLFPLNSVMIHGIVWANYQHANDPDFNSASFKSDVRAYFGSGTNLQELYINPARLNAGDWKNLAECIKWSRENAQTLSDTHWIGSTPAAGEVYGWASWQPDKGLLTLRNPSASSRQITLTLNDVLELPAGASTSYYLKSPWVEDATDIALLQPAGDEFTLTLAPFEVITLEATPDPPPSWHQDSEYREWALRLPSGQRTPDDPFGRNGFTNLMAYTTGFEPLAVSGKLTIPATLLAPSTIPGEMTFEYLSRSGLGNEQLVPQVSTDLITWNEGPAYLVELDRTPQANGTVLVRVRLADTYANESQVFFRLSARLSE